MRLLLVLRIALAAGLAAAAAAGYAQQADVGASPRRCKGRSDCGIVDAGLICAPKPRLPKLAKIAHVRGVVRLSAVIDERGSVQVLRWVSGHPLLVEAAIDAAKRYRFKPATAMGIPIQSLKLLDVTFDGG